MFSFAFGNKFKMHVLHATRQVCQENNKNYDFTYRIKLTYIPTGKSLEYTYITEDVDKHDIVTKSEFLSFIIQECIGFVDDERWVPVQDSEGVWYYNEHYQIENMSKDEFQRRKVLADDIKNIMDDDYESFVNGPSF
jgi:hypothetical protein